MGITPVERARVILWLTALGLSVVTAASASASESTLIEEGSASVILAVGAPGEPEFLEVFKESAELWKTNCQIAGIKPHIIGLDGEAGTNDLNRLKATLQAEPMNTSKELWLILLGHGTYDGKEAKFNLRGPDLSATELATLLEPFERPVAVVNATSSSGPFLNKLSKSGRVIITATRSGHELNYARFGRFFSATIGNLKADLDKDGQISLLESFLMAANDVAEFYKTEGRLATEHALIDDNGDGLGTPPDWFRGIRAVKKAKDGASLDGFRAHQFHLIRSDAERRLSPALRERRNELEIALEELRASKPQIAPDDYYQRLEILLLDLAKLYQESEKAEVPILEEPKTSDQRSNP